MQLFLPLSIKPSVVSNMSSTPNSQAEAPVADLGSPLDKWAQAQAISSDRGSPHLQPALTRPLSPPMPTRSTSPVSKLPVGRPETHVDVMTRLTRRHQEGLPPVHRLLWQGDDPATLLTLLKDNRINLMEGAGPLNLNSIQLVNRLARPQCARLMLTWAFRHFPKNLPAEIQALNHIVMAVILSGQPVPDDFMARQDAISRNLPKNAITFLNYWRRCSLLGTTLRLFDQTLLLNDTLMRVLNNNAAFLHYPINDDAEIDAYALKVSLAYAEPDEIAQPAVGCR